MDAGCLADAAHRHRRGAGAYARGNEAFNRALGVECTGCHIENEWDDQSKEQFGTARKMFRMVQTLNQTHLRDIGEISCWTSHRGEVRPSRLPRGDLDAELSRWPADLVDAPEQQKITMAVYFDHRLTRHTAGDSSTHAGSQ